MDASKTTSATEESVDVASIDWESMARDLLQKELERTSSSVMSEFRRVSSRLDRGEPLTEEDIHQLSYSLTEAQLLVESLENQISEQGP